MLNKEKIILLLAFLSISNFFALSVELKERLLITKNRVGISSLFLEPFDITNEISVESRYYTVSEVAEILKKNNINDVIIVGKGIEIKILSSITPLELKEKILSFLPQDMELNFTNFQLDSNLLFDRKNLNISNEINSNEIKISLEGFVYSNSVLSPTNLIFSFEVKQEKKLQEKYFLKKINGNFYELFYVKGNILIITKVRLIKRLEDSNYVVENLNGKKLKVRVENEI
jgi:hypothetical protein